MSKKKTSRFSTWDGNAGWSTFRNDDYTSADWADADGMLRVIATWRDDTLTLWRNESLPNGAFRISGSVLPAVF